MRRKTNAGEAQTNKSWLWICAAVFPGILLAVVWMPELRHNYVPGVKITALMLEQGQQQPTDAVLNEIRSHRLLPRHWKSKEELVATAEKLLKGKAEIPGFAAIELHLPFDPVDLDRGSTSWQLEYAGLIVPEIFLEAYQITGREQFYEQARDGLLAWASYEGKAWLDHGFLWNDHAVATRVRTLTDFWCLYRHRADYRPEIAEKIWEFAGRTGQLLAKPDRFTFATNHGVMQNLALWQLCVAFPSLPTMEENKRNAFSRLKDQMAFYIGPEGVVLEHSAGYHEFGLYLTGLALRYATLLNLEVPPDWRKKYKDAQGFYGELLRPDRSLPLFGDTEDTRYREEVPLTVFDSRGQAGPLEAAGSWVPRDSFGFYPAAGYAILWDGLLQWPSPEDLSQTVFSWSYYPGHGHKHADELSVLLWAGGQDWWTNAGYWPYDDPDHRHTDCWEGSNAPHLEGEECNSARTPSLGSYYYSSRFSAVEMERHGPDGFFARRLVVHVSPHTWIVADNSSGGVQKKVQTIWTTAPNVRVVEEATANAFTLSAEGTKKVLKTILLGPPAMKTSRYRGSHTPFAGWIASGGEPRPTDAILTEQAAEGSWAFAIWNLETDATKTSATEARPKVLEWGDGHNWKINIPSESGTQEIARREETISIRVKKSGATEEMSGSLLPCPSTVAAQVEKVHSNYQRTASRYPRFRDLIHYRFRASMAIVFLFLLQAMVLLACKTFMPRIAIAVGVSALLCWLALGVWLQLSYLRMT
jgi:hypothetical protein